MSYHTKLLVFLVLLGGGYGLAHAAGVPEVWATLTGWLVALAGSYVVTRRWAYRAGWRIESYRPHAAELRRTNPDLYKGILGQVRKNTDHTEMVRRDPDACVAAFLCHTGYEPQNLALTSDGSGRAAPHIYPTAGSAGGRERRVSRAIAPYARGAWAMTIRPRARSFW